MCDLKFSVTYSRRVQPRNYEHVTIGHKEDFQKGVVSREEAYLIVRDFVETEIDRRLQELYAREHR